MAADCTWPRRTAAVACEKAFTFVQPSQRLAQDRLFHRPQLSLLQAIRASPEQTRECLLYPVLGQDSYDKFESGMVFQGPRQRLGRSDAEGKSAEDGGHM